MSSDVLNQLAKKTRGKFVFNLVLLALIPKKVLQNAFSFFFRNVNLVSPENFTHRYLLCLRVRGADNAKILFRNRKFV